MNTTDAIVLKFGSPYLKHWPIAVTYSVKVPVPSENAILTTELPADRMETSHSYPSSTFVAARLPTRQTANRVHAWAEFFSSVCLSASVPTFGISVSSAAAAATAALVPPAFGAFVAVAAVLVGACCIKAHHTTDYSIRAYAYGLGGAAALGVLSSVAFKLSVAFPVRVALYSAALSIILSGIAMVTVASGIGLAELLSTAPPPSSAAV